MKLKTWEKKFIFFIILMFFVSSTSVLCEVDKKDKINLDKDINILKKQSKIDSQLEKIIEKEIKEESKLVEKIDKKIIIMLELTDLSQTNLDKIINLGGEIEAQYKNLVQVEIKINQIQALEKEGFIEYIRLPLIPYPDVVSEGVSVMGADTLHALSVTGSGVKIAILDGGFQGYSSLLGTELPSTVITKSYHSSGIEAGSIHGTACAEIVHDVAPDAQLCLVNFEFEGDFYNAIDWLIAQNVDIISFSMGYFNAGPGDGTGDICDKVNEAESNGILFVTSSGNFAEQHYEGYFQSGDGDPWHDFGPGDEAIPIYAYAEETIDLYLSWSASWPTYEDYDLWLFDSSSEVAWSLNPQDPSEWYPVESISYDVETEGWYYVGIYDYSTSANWELELFSPSHYFYDHRVPSSSITTPSDAAGAFSVGATYWLDDKIEPYSSQGPTNDGRTKPDVTAPARVTNSVYGTFAGTSAAAPHAAGAAALLLQTRLLSVSQLRYYLENGAIDLGAGGKDNVFGSGRIDIVNSYDNLLNDNTPPSVLFLRASSGGTRIDPGGEVETGTIFRVYSRVSDTETASSGLTVTLSYRPQGGDWTTASASYSAIKDYWYVDWTIPGDAATGLYDAKVDVEDPQGGSASSTELGEFTVVEDSA